MIDPRNAEPRDETTGEIRLSLGGEDDSVTQGGPAVRGESTAAPEFELSPTGSQIVEDLESREITDMMADGRTPGDMHFSEVLVPKEGLSLPVGVDRPISDLVSLEATAEELCELAEVEAKPDQCWSGTKIDPSLEWTEMLMDILGHLEHATPVIHAINTNGKTSTVRTIESLVCALGRCTGRTISPHLQLVTEYTAIDDQSIHLHDYVHIWREIQSYMEIVDAKSIERGGPQMSKFETLTVMAYVTLAGVPADVVVAEVGMSGTWDVIGVVEADMAVICPTSLDYTEHLDDTLAEVASEKAGTIKSRRSKDDLLTLPDNVAIVGEQESEAMDVILRRVVEIDISVTRAGVKYSVVSHQLAVGERDLTFRGLVGEYGGIHLPLYGLHQAHSTVIAPAAVEALLDAGSGRPLNVDAVREDFATVTSPSCLECVYSTPTVFIDATYGPHSARALRTVLSVEFDLRRVTGVLLVLGEKDARGLLVKLRPYFEEVIIARSASPCTLHYDDPVDLVEEILDEGRVHRVPTLLSAAELAVALVEEAGIGDDIVSGSGVIVTGSVVTTGEARTLFGEDSQ